jgi:putative endonuclease
MAIHNEIGFIGEDLAAIWLRNKGFAILDRNYRRKWGEIDIVARGTDKKVHFVEVKSVSHETKADLESAVLRGTYRPEDNVHKNKQDRLKRAIQTWISDNSYEDEVVIDILTVRIVPREKYAQVNLIENVVFE